MRELRELRLGLPEQSRRSYATWPYRYCHHNYDPRELFPHELLHRT